MYARYFCGPWPYFILLIAPVAAADPETTFETEVRPVVAKRCVGCHNAKTASGGLALDSANGFRTGGSSGVATAEAIRKALEGVKPFVKMPMGTKLPDAEAQVLTKWLTDGAFWPEPAPQAKAVDKARDFWSFQPVKDPARPAVRNRAWVRNEIDEFVLAKLEAEGLQPAPDADRRTLLRRVYFDLTGLPPTPEETRAFMADASPGAYAKLVDRLLASPRYGERWARHWLDVARYADTSGDTADYPIPQAYRYRDWVIRAFNQDLPFNEFLRYQLAGDLLAKTESDPEKYADKTVATGFIALSRRFGNNKRDLHLTIEDTIDTVGRGVMGLTLRCARCHDHKFDPMSVRDYYGMYGIFASTRYPWAGASDSSFPSDLVFLSPDAQVRAAAEKRFKQLADWVRQLNDIKYVPKPDRDRFSALTKQIQEGKDVEAAQREQQELLKKHAKFRDWLLMGPEKLTAERNRLAKEPAPCPEAFAVTEGEPKDVAIQRGGDPERLGKLVPRQFVEVAWNGSTHAIEEKSSGRLQLADWLADPAHPLVRRVWVNRVWYWTFGRGLVATPDNFGHRGERPTHPELLDYLASALAKDGWSTKALHRRILLSHTYQLSSSWVTANVDKDPTAVYLWRYPARRLEAEPIRDAMLAVSGELDLSEAGPHPFANWWEKKWNLNSPFKEVFDHRRRSVYLMTQRLFPHPFYELFDGPDTNQTTPLRDRSQMATQALYLMNSPFVAERSAAFAKRLRAASDNEAERIGLAFELAYARQPRPSELKASREFLARYRAAADDEAAWRALAWSVLSANEFFFVH